MFRACERSRLSMPAWVPGERGDKEKALSTVFGGVGGDKTVGVEEIAGGERRLVLSRETRGDAS